MFGGDDKPGYSTGEASQPRSAQFERTAVHIYQPAWDETTDNFLPWGRVERLQMLHTCRTGNATLEVDFGLITRTHGLVPPPPPPRSTTTTTDRGSAGASFRPATPPLVRPNFTG